MQDDSHNPRRGAPGGLHLTRELLLLLALEYGAFFLASLQFAQDSDSGDWMAGLLGGLVLFLVCPLSLYATGLAFRCRREGTVNRHLALVVMLLSAILAIPPVSIPIACEVSTSLEGLDRILDELISVEARGRVAVPKVRGFHRASIESSSFDQARTRSSRPRDCPPEVGERWARSWSEPSVARAFPVSPQMAQV